MKWTKAREKALEQHARLIEHLAQHVGHEEFEPTSSDIDRVVGWRCGCSREGCEEAEVSAGWYQRFGRWTQEGPWGDYNRVRAARAAVLSVECARRMRELNDEVIRDLAKDPAEQKAKELLLKCLSKKQKEQLEALGYFEQLGGDGNLYRLWAGSHRSIELIEDNEPTKQLCIHPKIIVPPSDTLLAQKLLVQGDIKRVYKTANVSDVRRR